MTRATLCRWFGITPADLHGDAGEALRVVSEEAAVLVTLERRPRLPFALQFVGWGRFEEERSERK